MACISAAPSLGVIQLHLLLTQHSDKAPSAAVPMQCLPGAVLNVFQA